MMIHLGSYNLYRFSIHAIDRTDKTVCQIRVSLTFFVIKYCHRDRVSLHRPNVMAEAYN